MKYSLYFNKDDSRVGTEIQYFKDKALYRPPIRISLSDAESLIQNKNFTTFPDPNKDYVWVYHSNMKREKQSIRNKSKLKSKLKSGNQASNVSSSYSRRYSFIKDEGRQANNSVFKIPKYSSRIRDILELLNIPDNPEVYQLFWLKTGEQKSFNKHCYIEFSKQLKDYYSNIEMQNSIKEKLKFLVNEGCGLLVNDENYNSFFNMVQNEVKLNGKEKMLKLFNNLLDQNIKQIKKKSPSRFYRSVPPVQPQLAVSSSNSIDQVNTPHLSSKKKQNLKSPVYNIDLIPPSQSSFSQRPKSTLPEVNIKSGILHSR